MGKFLREQVIIMNILLVIAGLLEQANGEAWSSNWNGVRGHLPDIFEQNENKFIHDKW